MFSKKLDRADELEVRVLLLLKPVPLILCHQIPRGTALITHGFHHLLGFSHRHARVVFPLHYE